MPPLAKIAVPFISWEPAVVFLGGWVFDAVGPDEIGGSDNHVAGFQGQIIGSTFRFLKLWGNFTSKNQKNNSIVFF
jgi:hypothetical protein